MKVGIFGQFYHEGSEKYIQLILQILQENKIHIFIEEDFQKIIEAHEGIDTVVSSMDTFKALDNSYDLFFSIGGDGTILKSITYVRDLGIPIVGINTGRLGFLATIPKEEVSIYISKILKRAYTISERTLLTISTKPAHKKLTNLNFALNEVSVNRKNTTSMIKVETHIDGEHLTSYWSDGLIVATPTGSTGYSLSCGGPVIEPTTKSFVITPIAPHNLNARPFVVPDSYEIKLNVTGREDSFLLSLDSRTVTIDNETKIAIKKAPFTIKMVQMDEDSFIKTLRKKLFWGEDRRN